ncbi:MAG: UbiA family prenyltransferase [Thermoplasmatota archaeon]
MKKTKAIWQLMRLEHGIMIFLGILIGSVIALGGKGIPSWDKFILTFFTALFLEASTFALNDYFDYEIDKKNQRYDRPLVRGDIQPKTALYLFIIFYPLGIICAYFVNIVCFLIALFTAVFAVLYDSHMKRVKFLGNFYVAYTMAIPFVFGGAAVLEENILALDIHPAIFIIALIAFFAGSGREIMKDVQDYEGDKEKGVRSFPKYIGKRKSNMLAAFFYIIAIALSFLPFFMQQYTIYYMNFAYLVPILLCDNMLLTTALQLIFKDDPDMKLYRKITLLAIFIGLVGFLLGAFLR